MRRLTGQPASGKEPNTLGKKISLLGSTGSIGTQTVDVVRRHPEEFQVVALAAGRRLDLLAQQAGWLRPDLICVADSAAAAEMSQLVGRGPEIVHGPEGLVAAATHPEAKLVVMALVGILGLEPTLAAIESGRNTALANKETLVAGGELVMDAARRRGVKIIPVDSEHNAIFQCLQGQPKNHLARLILTASGGPFRTWTRAEMESVTPEQALKHPRWSMGRKVSTDSATLMNKALELIEAHWLFDTEIDRVDVLIHPESIVHSLVEFVDGSVLAQMGITDMRIPIQYALTYPIRLPTGLPRLDLAALGRLTFEPTDSERFPSLNYARAAVRIGGTLPTAMNAANEVAVERFLTGEIRFTDIYRIVAAVMDAHSPVSRPRLGDVLEANRWARQTALDLR
jgi:1-deoxy-D-xylulose-5-phosphate reductoisomerase